MACSSLVLLVVVIDALVFIVGIIWPPPPMWPEDEVSERGRGEGRVQSPWEGDSIHLGDATCNRNLAPSSDQGGRMFSTTIVTHLTVLPGVSVARCFSPGCLETLRLEANCSDRLLILLVFRALAA